MLRFRRVRVSLGAMALCLGLIVAGPMVVLAQEPTATPLPPAPAPSPVGTAAAPGNPPTGTSVVGSPGPAGTEVVPSAPVPPAIPPPIAPTNPISTGAIITTIVGVAIAVLLVAAGGLGLIRMIGSAGRL